MAKILQFVRMIWGFISIWFVKFGTYVGKRQKQRHEDGDILKWQREEVTKLQEVLKAEQVLNEKQCRNLVKKLDQVALHVNEMITSSAETTNRFGLLLEELRRITRKVIILVQDCGKQEWCHVVAFQMNNTEAFRELVEDLKCFWDAMCKRYLAIYPDSQNFTMPCIDFGVANYDEVESDEEALVKILEKRLEMPPNDSEDYELAKHLLKRLQFELREVKGAELGALEIPKDVPKPEFLDEIGSGAAGKVHKARWLGLESAIKMVGGSSNFRKEASILACLGHPNLVKFIGCGRFDKTHEENLDGSNNVSNKYFLVMELMEMSLSDWLKKQNTLLPYLVAIDVMHEIARGMCYLHDMHVAHLDLKPSNVLLSSVPRLAGVKGNIGYDFVKLTDYDTSKMEVQSKPELQEFTIGTPRYMAPEMNNNNKGNSPSNMACPFPADVWSFGMTCSEILSLKEPFSGATRLDVISQKIKDCWRPVLPENCEELTTLIEECWIQDPSQRPTFSNICERLATLKKKFMVGIYSNDSPQFTTLSTEVKKASNQINISSLKKVDPRTTQNEAVVGLESNLAKVKNHLKQVNIVGLIGMGGIGKTTLAKAIFDDVRSTYDASCFIEDLKSRHSLEILCEIIEKFGRHKESSWTLEEAKKITREMLDMKKVLLVLDDPRDAPQVCELIPTDVSTVHNGTKIMITTRDWALVENRVDVKGRIDVDKLDGNAAKELFDSYVFVDGAQLSPQLFDLCDKIIEKCNGLPLSLKVMGAFLRGKERIRSWERAFQRMKRGRHLDGDEGLWSTLMISFDGLETSEKNMFLDLACFLPMCMWKDRALRTCTNYGASPNYVLDILVDKSLVNINEKGYLEMHDQLRDMGRMIVETKKEYLGTRIWKLNMLPLRIESTHDKVYKKIEAIYINEEISQWLRDDSTGMKALDVSSLQLLICRGLIALPKGLGNLTSLTTMDLAGCSSLTTLPEELGNSTLLTTLNLAGCSRLTTLPEGVGNLTSLTTLNLSFCQSLRKLPDGLGNLTSLTTLDLSFCYNLIKLPDGLGNFMPLPKGLWNLTSLTTLNLRGCTNFTTLPWGLGNLTSLITLDLSQCCMLETLPEELGNLSSLTTMDLSRSSILRTLPKRLAYLTSLTTLNLSDCWRLTTLPELGWLINLRILNLSKCVNLRHLPWDMEYLTSLTTLNLHECTGLRTLPEGVGNLTSLTTLELSKCLNLTTLPKGVGSLTSLTTLNLCICSSLTTLPEELGNLSSLTTLDLRECSSLTTLPEELGNLTSLTTLKLSKCSGLTTLPEGVGNLTSLTTLELSGCSNLRTLPKALWTLTSLTTLNLSTCSSMTTLPQGLWKLTSLTTLDLSGCRSLTTLPEGLENLTALTTLELCRCSILTTLPDGLWNLTSLTKLNLSHCSSLTTLPKGLVNLTALRVLDLFACSSLTTLPEGLGKLTSLTTLNLYCCSSLTTLPDGLWILTSLTDLDLSRCSSLTTLPEELGNLTCLKKLGLEGCSSLTTLPEGLGNLSFLMSLFFFGCSGLTTLPKGLGNLTSLNTIYLSYCSSLTTLPEELGNLTSLTKLSLSNCSSLSTLPQGLGNLTSLETLNLSKCSSLRTLPQRLGNLTSLTEVNVEGCSSLTTLPQNLVNLISSRTLNLSKCSSLTTLPKGLGNLLTELYLSECSSLTTLPEELGNLTSLRIFDLSKCSSLTTLPQRLGNLTSLVRLDLSQCSSLTTLPKGLRNLTSLRKLNLTGCSSLATLPERLGNLTSLMTLDLSGCSSLTTLPEGLGNLTSLDTLDLSGCSSLTTSPEELENLRFYMRGIGNFSFYIKGIGNLTSRLY